MSNELTTQTPETESYPMAVSFDTGAISAHTQALAQRNELMYKMAQTYSNSGLVPQAYQKKPNDCFIAVDMADRMGIQPLFVMQNMYVVQGKPSWSGQACISLVNNCGKFEDLRMVFVGREGQDDWGCYAVALRKDNGEEVKGSTVTMKMAKDEGWYGKNGSKWKTMPEQMMKYRAAAFFARTYCPEALMGLSVADEGEYTAQRRTAIAEDLTQDLRDEYEDEGISEAKYYEAEQQELS